MYDLCSQAVGESLQCPRCSANVPANPGVCSNCGENVFQCHKCRAINYDEKDSFLCNSFGFCKYAKFEYSLTARPSCSVDPIENEEDRKKALSNINSLLERADKVYRQQEEFLQGRMLGNPYSSKEPVLGPLMREVKNKIYTDCELVALLEDDNGMELLVNNKIISLDMPVKDVYSKVWLPEAGEGEPMMVVYRMRGLLGDATEEFIENLSKTYKLAGVMGECGGLAVILHKLATITNKTLLSVLLKLKIKANREKLLEPCMAVTAMLLATPKLCLTEERVRQSSNMTDNVLQLMEKLLVDSNWALLACLTVMLKALVAELSRFSAMSALVVDTLNM